MLQIKERRNAGKKVGGRLFAILNKWQEKVSSLR